MQAVADLKKPEKPVPSPLGGEGQGEGVSIHQRPVVYVVQQL